MSGLEDLFQQGQRYTNNPTTSTSSSSSFSQASYFRTQEEKHNIGNESEFIKKLILHESNVPLYVTDANGYSIDNFANLMEKYTIMGQMHTCNSSRCQYKNINKGTLFEYQSQIWKATGLVFVCYETLKVHVCGEEYCLNQMVMPCGEGMVCSITGMFLAQEYSTATAWNDRDIRMVGNHTYATFGSVDSNDVAQSQRLEKRQALTDLNATNNEVHDDEHEVNNASILKSMHLTKIPKAPPSKMSFESQLMKLSRGEERDITRVMAVYTTDHPAFIKAKKMIPELTQEEFLLGCVHDRANRRRQAEAVWKAFSVSKEYIEDAINNSKKASEIYLAHATAYVKSCVDKRQQYDIFHVMMLWYHYAFHTYKQTYYSTDVDSMNKKYSKYYIECMLRVWELYEYLPVVYGQGIQFSQCAANILKRLSEGLFVRVYYVRGNPKPRLQESLFPDEIPNAYYEEVTFIPPHPNLVLAAPASVRKRYPTIVKTTAATKGFPVTSLVGGRRGAGVRTKTSNIRKSKPHGSTMPANKLINNIIRSIIESSATKEELQKYVFVK
jgi:hypothetical protein